VSLFVVTQEERWFCGDEKCFHRVSNAATLKTKSALTPLKSHESSCSY
jgi:hypothetical protein